MAGANGARVVNEEVEMVPLVDLLPHPENPRQGDIGAIHESIRHNGFYGTIVCQRSTGRILAGNHRYLAAKEAGLDALPVAWVDVDDETARRILLVDNRTNDLASYDDEALAKLLAEINVETGSLEGTGYDGDDLDALLRDLGLLGDQEETDAIPEIPAEAKSKRGEVYELGRHRLMCGDATSEDAWDKLAVERPAMVFTSPPYGVGDSAKLRDHYVPGAKVRETLYAGHDDDPAAWPGLMASWSALALARVDVVVCNVQMLANNKRALLEWLHQLRANLVDIAVWDKVGGAPQMHPGVMTNAFEWIVIFSPESDAPRRIPLASWHGTIHNVVRVDPRGANEFSDVHRAVMPTDVASWAIQLCDGASAVVDPFAGTGTTIIAAERQGRTCYAMEIDPRYCDVARQRYANFVGEESYAP